MENAGVKTKQELICKHREAGIICKREGVNGTYGNCDKCGWCPETEKKRKEKYREEHHVSI